MGWYIVILGVIVYILLGIVIFVKLVPKYCDYVGIRIIIVTVWPILLLLAGITAIVLFLYKGLPENW